MRKLTMTVEEAADSLSVEPADVLELLHRGELWSLQLDGKHFISIAAVDEFVDRLTKEYERGGAS